MDFHPPAARAEDAAARVEQKPVPANGPAPATEALRPEPFVSVVIPVYNEAQVLPLLLPRLLAALAGAAAGWEALFVNDGSSDGSFHILESQGRIDPHLKVIDLSRNFGHSAAITAGLDHARGVCLGLMGEYVARIFEEVKDRPLYFVRRAVNLEPTAPEEDAGARPGA